MKSYYSFDFNRDGFVLGDTFDIVQKEIKLKKKKWPDLKALLKF